MQNILTCPTDLIISRPKHLAYHNLYQQTTKLPDLRPLLGLGLNFCIKPNHKNDLKTF